MVVEQEHKPQAGDANTLPHRLHTHKGSGLRFHTQCRMPPPAPVAGSELAGPSPSPARLGHGCPALPRPRRARPQRSSRRHLSLGCSDDQTSEAASASKSFQTSEVEITYTVTYIICHDLWSSCPRCWEGHTQGATRTSAWGVLPEEVIKRLRKVGIENW